MLRRLESAERALDRGQNALAIHQLETLRSRVDGRGEERRGPDRNDWIVDCDAQLEIRRLIVGVRNLERCRPKRQPGPCTTARSLAAPDVAEQVVDHSKTAGSRPRPLPAR